MGVELNVSLCMFYNARPDFDRPNCHLNTRIFGKTRRMNPGQVPNASIPWHHPIQRETATDNSFLLSQTMFRKLSQILDRALRGNSFFFSMSLNAQFRYFVPVPVRQTAASQPRLSSQCSMFMLASLSATNTILKLYK